MPQRHEYPHVIAQPRRRLDQELVRRQLASSRELAQRLITNGDVLVNGVRADKPARQVLPGDAIVIVGEGPRYVSRGGDKLHYGLVAFGVDPAGRRGLDVGSSTGGFTDCLLQAGAHHVVAVDVGTHQLHERLRNDARVTIHEQVDIRAVTPESIGGPFDVVVCDVSFIGLGQVIDAVLAQLDPNGVAIVLVKPQFEAGKSEASKGKGVITDPEIWRRVLGEVVDTIGQAGGLVVDGAVSPIKGGAGNVEFLLALCHRRSVVSDGESGVVSDGGSGAVPGWATRTALRPGQIDELVDQASGG